MMYTLKGHPNGFTVFCITMYHGFSEEPTLGLVNINNLIQLLGDLKQFVKI